jgi:predicted transcriptional regulator
MKMLTKTQYKVLLILLDNEGHPGWSLAKELGKEESNLNPILKKLEKMGIIFQGKRTSTNIKDKKGDYQEFPYYLKDSLENIKILIKEIVESKKIHETYFVFRVMMASKYINSMKEKFGEKVKELMIEELSKSYIDLKEFFIFDIINPSFLIDDLNNAHHPMRCDIDEELNNILEKNFKRVNPLEIPSGLETWYIEYLKRRYQKSNNTNNN